MNLIGMILVSLGIGIAGVVLFPKRISWKEMLLILAVGSAVSVAAFFIGRYIGLMDTEHLNGRITAKDHGEMGCCHCQDVCDARDEDGVCTSSHEECDHFHDYYWDLKTTVGTISIDRCVIRKNDVPRAWTKAYIGEPASVTHAYAKFIKADPDSLVNKGADKKMMASVPKFPSIYEHYKVKKVVGKLPKEWDAGLREINSDLGHSKQVDITIIATTNQDPRWADALETKWLYGPKNSLNIVVGVKDGVFTWVRVVTISKVELLKESLMSGLKEMKVSEWEKGLALIRKETQDKFTRTPNEEFRYLLSAATPPTWILIIMYIIVAILSIVLVLVAREKDIFGDEGLTRRFNPFNRRR